MPEFVLFLDAAVIIFGMPEPVQRQASVLFWPFVKMWSAEEHNRMSGRSVGTRSQDMGVGSAMLEGRW